MVPRCDQAHPAGAGTGEAGGEQRLTPAPLSPDARVEQLQHGFGAAWFMQWPYASRWCVVVAHASTRRVQIMMRVEGEDRNVYGPYFCLLEPKYLAVIAINSALLVPHPCLRVTA